MQPRNELEGVNAAFNANRLPQIVFKVLVVGDPNVGKTALIDRMARQKYTEGYKATIGVDFAGRKFKYQDMVVAIQFWDLAGQTKIGEQSSIFMKNSNFAICVVDVTDKLSYTRAIQWKDYIKRSVTVDGEVADVPCVFVANKVDIYRSNVIDEMFYDAEYDPTAIIESDTGKAEKDTSAFGLSNGYAEGFAVSAKTGHNVEQLIEFIKDRLVDKWRIDEATLYSRRRDPDIIDLNKSVGTGGMTVNEARAKSSCRC